MAGLGLQHSVHRQHVLGVTLRADQPGADVELVGAQVQDGVFQVTGEGQRVPVHASSLDGGSVGLDCACRGLGHEGGSALGAVDLDGEVGVAETVGVQGAHQRGQADALGTFGAVAAGSQGQGALLHLLGKHRRLGDVIHQAPVLGLLAAHAFHAGAEQVGQVMAHLALVGHAGQAARARQHAQQRHLRQAHGAGAVVHQDDLVAGQGHLVAAAGAGAVDSRQELQAVVLGGIFQSVARLVGELAEVHLPGVAGHAQHEDVGAGAKHLFLGAGQHHGAHFRVLEADAVDGVVELDVHTQVVAVELELVARAQAGVLVEVGLQGSHSAVERQLPVAVLGRAGLVVDAEGSAHGCLQCMVSRLTNSNAY